MGRLCFDWVLSAKVALQGWKGGATKNRKRWAVSPCARNEILYVTQLPQGLDQPLNTAITARNCYLLTLPKPPALAFRFATLFPSL